MTATVIMCEDDLNQLQQLETIIRNYILFHNEQFHQGIATQTPQDVLEYTEKFSINGGIYLLDIDLHNELNGIQLAKKLLDFDKNARFIFITTHDEMAITALQMEVRAFDFIIKDQSLDSFMDKVRESLINARNDIDNSLNNKKQAFSFYIGKQIINLNFDDIYYISSSNIPHQVSLVMNNQEFSFYSNLKTLEGKYPHLFRANRNVLVNIKNIKEVNYSTHEIIMINGFCIKYTNRKSKLLRSLLV